MLAEAENEKSERGDLFLADVLYLHACMQIANSKRKPGFASLERAIALDPANENLKEVSTTVAVESVGRSTDGALERR